MLHVLTGSTRTLAPVQLVTLAPDVKRVRRILIRYCHHKHGLIPGIMSCNVVALSFSQECEYVYMTL